MNSEVIEILASGIEAYNTKFLYNCHPNAKINETEVFLMYKTHVL